MLRNMFIGDPPGNTDRVLDFSTAVTGGMFFTPIVDLLNDPPPLPDSAPEEAAAAVVPASSVGSLSIGSLKGTP
jgi:putative iron-dependent peroxidase